MGQMGADHALSKGASESPSPYVLATASVASVPPPPAPNWMDAPTAKPEVQRKGHSTAAARSGLHTLLFFGLIIFVVGAAGLGAMMLWGPEKTVKNRTQFATNPPPPTALPSLPASADAHATPSAEAAPAPEPAVSTRAAAPAPAKKAQKARSTRLPMKHPSQ